jgi:peptidoglycan/LPS O-acetylase OafA/YrhL
MTHPKSGSRINDIEVLRAVAILMTLVGHTAELLYYGGPVITWSAVSLWGGVDLFFCISGFVITRTLIDSVPPRSGTANFLRFAIPFWIRRVFRIWPAAFFWLGVAILLSIFFNKFGSFGTLEANLRDALAAVFHVANLHYYDCLTLKSGTCFNLVGIYWSLSLEEQFYFIFPFVLFAFSTRSLTWILLTGVLLQLFLPRPPWSLMWALRSDTLMLGVLIAIAQTRREVIALAEPYFLKSKIASIMTFALGVTLIGLVPYVKSSATGLDIDKPIVWFNTGLLALVCAVMVFIASFGKGYTFPEGFLKKILVYVGSRSFALYLAHNPMYFVTRELFHRWYPGVTFDNHFALRFIIVAAILSLAGAELSYRLVETPLRRIGRRKASEYRDAHPLFVSPAKVL